MVPNSKVFHPLEEIREWNWIEDHELVVAINLFVIFEGYALQGWQ